MNYLLNVCARTLLLCAIIISVSSCRQKEDPTTTAPPAETGTLQLEFLNIVGNQPLTLDSQWYLNASNDSFQVTLYRYYISNILLVKSDGSIYKAPESYYLIDQSDAASRKFVIGDVPAGDYVAVSFLIGVDSLRNVSGAQTGALDPQNGMFWTWNTGYIMAKLEGRANTSVNVDKSFLWHCGGFQGADNVIKNVQLALPVNAVVGSAKTPEVHINSDVLEWFKTPADISIANFTNVQSGKKLVTIANNYADMFRVDHVDN